MINKYLLGTKNNQIIIAEVETTTRNGYKEFTCSFNGGEAFKIDEIDDNYKKDYLQEYWDCCDYEGKLKLLDDGDITRDQWMENVIRYDNGYRDYKDCSCTDYETIINNETINFESTRCGQYDCREDEDFEDMKFTNKKGFNLLMELWDQYHLNNVENNKEFESKLNEASELLENYKEGTDEFCKFIKNNIEL